MTAVTTTRKPSHTPPMGAISYISDRLTNALTGTGTRRDARSANAYVPTILNQQQIDAAYRGSGLMKKIIGIPALDMVREWRDWTGLDADQASKVFDEEKRHELRQKIRTVEIMRGLGGGALILGLPGLPDQPAPSTITKGGLAFVHVVSRWHLHFDKLQDDATKPGYGEPLMWRMNSVGGQQKIHPSRVIPFRADTAATLATVISSPLDCFWGESKVQQVLDAVQDSDTARASFAALIHKARLLRIGIPDLISLAAQPDGEGQVMNRLAILATAESIHNATIYDAGSADDGKGGEKIDDVTYSFAGAKDVMNCFAEFVCAVSDIPATRLLGRAPEGMNSSGESQQQDWGKLVRAMQTLDLAPCLDRLDRYLVPSATGAVVATAAYEFAPLDLPGQKEKSERFKTQMEAIDKLQQTGTIPDREFARGVQSLMVEEGYLPELESALKALPDDERYGIEQGSEEGGDLSSAGMGGSDLEADPPRRAANDAALKVIRESAPSIVGNDAKPRTLYVHRKLLNGADLVKWAKSQGFKVTLPASDMHTTIAFSRQAIDWMKVEPIWDHDAGELKVPAGGARLIEQFDGGAVVLLFNSSTLAYRHEVIKRAGASWDHPEYQPHITLTYDPGEVDLDQVEPFQGELRFGPEIFEELDLDWKAKIEEA
ncbi:phage portal protein [Allopontixanthobacter sediminis]|uniref:Anti-CBASS protein Acb1 n=1 Tax=Allopontixanthobacter sediminis TaxID=1689985 RepID=A0A845AZW6_9SPHN|nr:anti-CBASS Acb1 family protein [Allopontixanthobacter sediminis]MXP42972.1 DUF1073 domain-containing protein [Allopontixanthobacter sediminis]